MPAGEYAQRLRTLINHSDHCQRQASDPQSCVRPGNCDQHSKHGVHNDVGVTPEDAFLHAGHPAQPSRFLRTGWPADVR